MRINKWLKPYKPGPAPWYVPIKNIYFRIVKSVLLQEMDNHEEPSRKKIRY